MATYGSVAKMAGLPGYARYVGAVLKKLPAGSRLPWHRVVNAQGRLSFAPDSRQYLAQKTRPEAEGIVVIRGRPSPRKYGSDHTSIPSPGITIRVVRTKNSAQSPCRKSTTTPLPAASVVRPKLEIEAISAY